MMEHKDILHSFGAKGLVMDELMRYCDHKFEKNNDQEPLAPMDAPHIKAYQRYQEEAQKNGAFNTLSKYLVQLQFPIQEGISQTAPYRDTVLRGKPKRDLGSLGLSHPERIKLEVYQDDLVGKVPIILVSYKSDFQKMVCALAHKNEPEVLPESMGASFIKGLNNWDRINELKKGWLAENPLGAWSHEFKHNVLPNKELYQDQIIILSEQPYSNISAEILKLDQEVWKEYSVIIRRAHECAHLFTLREYGKIKNHIFDELIADYVGITSAIGRFDPDWFLHFMGLEDPNEYREGGRFQNYTTSLSSEAAQILQKVLIKASYNLYKYDEYIRSISDCCEHRKKCIALICEAGLLRIASESGQSFLKNKFESDLESSIH